MIKVYGIKNCDTMKKAFTWLGENDLSYEFIDYKKAGIVASHVNDWISRTSLEMLLNKRGLTWRKLSEEERADVDQDKAAQLMTQYPSLIKRPVLDNGKQLLVGFSPENYAEALK